MGAVFERQRLRRLRHDVGMTDIEEEDQGSTSPHTQGTQLTKSREDLVRAGDGLVLLSRGWVPHVAEHGTIIGHLSEGPIIAVHMYTWLARYLPFVALRTGKIPVLFCSRRVGLLSRPRFDRAWRQPCRAEPRP